MKYDELIRSVASETAASKAQADEAVLVTLTLLAESIGADETRDLLAQLPKSFKERVPIPAQRSPIGPDEFMRRAAERIAGIDGSDAERYVRAVFATLREAVNAGEMRDIADRLGDEYAGVVRGADPQARRPIDIATGVMGRVAQTVTEAPRSAIRVACAAFDTGIRATREVTGRVGRLIGRFTG